MNSAMDPGGGAIDRPRVLHLVEAFGGGTYHVIRDITEKTADRFEHLILHGSRRGMDSNAFPVDFPGVTMWRWRHAVREIRPLADAFALFEAVGAVRRWRPHVIHCHSSKGGALGRMAASITGYLPCTIYTPHGVWFSQPSLSPLLTWFFTTVERSLGKLSEAVIACSASELTALRSAGIDAILIPNGVEGRAPIVRNAAGRNGPRRVVSVGRIAASKEPARFNTLACMLRERTDVEFRWVGDGPLRGVLTSPNITVLGWLTRDEVYRELRDADIYCSTSSSEGLSIAALEAMSFGLPLLMTDCVGNRDLVTPENGRHFVEGADGASILAEMLDAPESLSTLGQQSRNMALSRYDLRSTMSKYADLYHEVAFRT